MADVQPDLQPDRQPDLPGGTVASRATYRDVLAVGEFRVLLSGWLLFMLGETAQVFGLATLVYQQTGSPALQSLAYVVGFLPHVLGGSALLALADRVPARTLMTGTDLVRAGVVLVLALAGLPVWAVLALVFAKATLIPVAGAARSGLVADVLPGDGYVLGRALFSVAGSGMQVIGFALGGALVSVSSPRAALLVTAGCCLANAGLSRFGLRRRAAGVSAAPRASVVRTTWAVNRLLFRMPAVRGLLACQWLFPTFVTGAESLSVPYVSELGADPGTAGVLLVALPIGMLLGDALVGGLVAPAGRERLVLPLAVVTVAPLLTYAAHPPVPVAAAAMGLSGFGAAYALGVQRAFLDALPGGCRNQGLGLASTGLMTAQGVGAVALGGLAELAGGATWVITGAGAAGLGGAFLLRDHLRPYLRDHARPARRRPGRVPRT